MSRENLDLVLEMYELFNRRDIDVLLESIDEGIEIESRLVAMEGGYRGHDGLRRWWADLLEFIPDYRVEADELHDLGDIALARARGQGHGAASTAPLVETFWQPIKFRDGKCVWWRNCMTEADALEAIAWP